MPWVTKHSGEEYPPQTPPPPLSQRDRAFNWWQYYKWLVGVAVLAVIAIGITVGQLVTQVRPDYTVGCVTPVELPLATVDALTAALADLGSDQNGDGRVVVELEQYILDFSPQAGGDALDSAGRVAGATRLNSDLEKGRGGYIYLLADPEGFARYTAALADLDGATPDDPAPEDWPQRTLPWTACPVLTALDLGGYKGSELLGQPPEGSSQDFMSGFYLARRTLRNDKQAAAAAPDIALWQAMTAGAAPQEGTK